MFAFIAKAIRNIMPRKRVAVPHNMPQSRKHIRRIYWTFGVDIAYYGHNGRKLTMRRYSYAQYARVVASARANGYKVV